ncbi:MAG: HDOD domain-containing protein, partial [bacterium]|nr:HDOD domain-containing protein [bacterium]
KLPIDIEKIFVIGLLHDIGKIILSQYIEDKIEEINYHVAKENLLFYEAEKKILGFNHAEVGSMLLNKWKIPKDIINTVKYHHNPYENKESNTLYTKVVYLADILVNSLAIGIGYDCKKFIMNSLILDELNIKTEEINDIIEQFIIKIDLINLLDFV